MFFLECFNFFYGILYFLEYVEKILGVLFDFLLSMVKENKVYFIGGFFFEEDNGKLFNICCVFNFKGEMIVKYRKIYLFDIDVFGKIWF